MLRLFFGRSETVPERFGESHCWVVQRFPILGPDTKNNRTVWMLQQSHDRSSRTESLPPVYFQALQNVELDEQNVKLDAQRTSPHAAIFSHGRKF
jgi:hypothetical protein